MSDNSSRKYKNIKKNGNVNLKNDEDSIFCDFCGNMLEHCMCVCPYCGKGDECECVLSDPKTRSLDVSHIYERSDYDSNNKVKIEAMIPGLYSVDYSLEEKLTGLYIYTDEMFLTNYPLSTTSNNIVNLHEIKPGLFLVLMK